MDKIKVDEITIIYDDSCLDKMDDICETIRNNTGLFLRVMQGKNTLSLIPLEEDDTCACLEASEFDIFLRNL